MKRLFIAVLTTVLLCLIIAVDKSAGLRCYSALGNEKPIEIDCPISTGYSCSNTKSMFGKTLLTSRGCSLTVNCKDETTCCNTDLCNSGSGTRPSLRPTLRPRPAARTTTTARPMIPSDVKPLKSVIPLLNAAAQVEATSQSHLIALGLSTLITYMYLKFF